MIAGQVGARSVEVPARSRHRALSFAVGVGAALGLALAVQAIRSRGGAPEPIPTVRPPEAVAPTPPATKDVLATPAPSPREGSVTAAETTAPPANPAVALQHEAAGKPVVGHRGPKAIGRGEPAKKKPRPEPAPAATAPITEKPPEADNVSGPKDPGKLLETF